MFRISAQIYFLIVPHVIRLADIRHRHHGQKKAQTLPVLQFVYFHELIRNNKASVYRRHLVARASFFFFFFPRFGELRGNGSSARPGTTSSCVRIMCLPIVGARYDHFPRKPLARRLAGLYAASGTHLFLRLACIPMSWLITERAGREEALRDCVASGVLAKACPAWTFQRLRATLRFCFGSAANKR